MRDAAEAAAARAAELLAEPVEAEEETSEQPEAAVADEEPQETAAEETELPDFEAKVPEDVLEALDMPEFEQEPEEETEEGPEDEYDPEEEDPKVAKLKKQVQFFQERAAEAKRSKWEEEARKFFPLSEPTLATITATSRRGFLREARAAHETILPYVKELRKAFESNIAAAKEEAKVEARKEVEEAWGKPTSQTAPPEAHEKEEEISKTRTSLSFEDRIRSKYFPKE